jgi:hypothetical protein
MSPDAAERWSNSANSSGTYNIRSGDTLSDIAQRELGSSSRWREIKKADGSSFSASEAGRLQVGQQISLPGTNSSTNKPGGGETAKLRGMSPDAAERWSNPKNSQKPAPNLRGMSPDAAERWSNPTNNQKPPSKLRGMSPDAAERWSNPTENREATSASNRRPMSTFQQDFAVGVLKGAWDVVQETGALARGVYDLSLNPNREVREQTAQSVGDSLRSLAQNPAVQSLANPILAVQNFTSRPRETTKAFKDLGTGFAQPYVDAWRSGHPGEAVGRGTFDLFSMFVPGGAIIKPVRAIRPVATAANVADEAGDLTRVTGRIAGAKQALNPQNAAPSGRGSRPLGERPTSNSAPSTDRRSTAKPPRSKDLPQSSNGGTNNPPTGHNTNRPGNNAAPSGTGSRPLGGRGPGSETGRVGTGSDRANVFSQRLDELSVHPRTGKSSPKSREEAETILQAEQQGLLQGTPHRPLESRQSEGLDFELKDHNGRVIGYADTKNPIEPKYRAVSQQAQDIAKKINSYQPNLNLKVVIDLKKFDSAQKQEFKAYLADQVENMSKVIFLNG